MASKLSSQLAATTIAVLTAIALASCGGGNNPNQGGGTNNSSSSPSNSPTTSTSASSSPTALTQGVAPQGTNCPSTAPVKAVNSKRLGKVALTSASPVYKQTKPEKCFANTTAAQQAGYKIPK